MSDQIFNGGGVATEEPPAEVPEAPVTGSRRNLVVVGVAVAIALAVAVWFLFLSGGGSGSSGAVAQSPVHANGAGNGVTASKSAKVVVVKPASSRDKKGRNPFHPLLVEPSSAPSASSAAAAASSAPASSVAASSPAVTNTVATVDVVKISSGKATFNVTAAGTTKKYAGVAVGQTFATFFKLYDLGSKCAQIQYGDQTGTACVGTPLTLNTQS
ncbi:MAG TPA: hypothetical protein VMI11_08560 [Actinomycetes bacterium]|nr:hypothetical protein [Actinomycetes bacterium]